MDRAFQYPSHIQEIPHIRKDLEFLEQEWSINKSEVRQILVIIEEIFSNIIRYGYEDKLEHSVDLIRVMGVLDIILLISFLLSC